MSPSFAHEVTWLIAALAVFAIITRPWGLPEAVWAVAGAAVLVLGSLVSWTQARAAMLQGTDVYLFLAGMMLLAELARTEGLFDWIAALAVRWARGAPYRLFGLVYLVGIVVTALLSNDATAVVLTPAVYAAATKARTNPLPYLLICAFIANAASFLLPISNPANLVVFASHLPPLPVWLVNFLGPSLVAIVTTYFVLRATQRQALSEAFASTVPVPPLTRGARLAALGILLTAVVLLWASTASLELGLPTFVAGGVTTTLVLVLDRHSPWPIIKGVSWGVIPLVAGLFVLVAGLGRTGLLSALGGALQQLSLHSGHAAALAAGAGTAAASNVMNNLPVALIAGSIGVGGHVSSQLQDAMLVGVDLGPNLSVTGSLATILWLIALRRENVRLDGLTFLRLGVLVMPPALLLSLAVLVLQRSL
ncbi:MAG TPA: arsenic transporter [Steroidobacteraceae bacterium]|jgi:arsenical pump membrane protein|nr:arsenic transporter [Steroidobacteraceae bacterium]